jgi:hypothetical protein
MDRPGLGRSSIYCRFFSNFDFDFFNAVQNSIALHSQIYTNYQYPHSRMRVYFQSRFYTVLHGTQSKLAHTQLHNARAHLFLLTQIVKKNYA